MTTFRDKLLAGKTAFVAGASSGINLQIATRLAQAGAKVTILSRSPDSAGAKGYVQDAALADGMDIKDAVVYACGSESMIASAKSKLVAAGLNPKNFHSDAFVSSN